MKTHAMNMQLEVLCGRNARVTTITNGRRNDRLAKLITCKTCKRIWRRLSR